MINRIVNSDFASKPLRIMPEEMCIKVQIKNGELLMRIMYLDHNNYNLCFVPTVRQWVKCEFALQCINFYQADVMRPYLPKTVRFGETYIQIEEASPSMPYIAEHAAILDSISHIWSESLLRVSDHSNIDQSSLNLVLSSSSIRCRTLVINGCSDKIQLLETAISCAIHAIDFYGYYSPNEILQILRLKASFPQSETIFMVSYRESDFQSIMATISQVRFVKLHDTFKRVNLYAEL